MANYNKVILLGNLTKDPELSYTPGNTAVCEFAIATNRRYRDPAGNNRDETCFIDCTIFGKSAETFNQYMSRGKGVLVEGRLILQQWEDKQGNKRSRHKVTVLSYQFVGSGEGESGARREPARRDSSPPPADLGTPVPDHDDIPF